MDDHHRRETSVFFAKMAERTRRYDDMVEAMSDVAKMNVELTAEERRLLSDGLKHAVVERRNAGIMLSAMEREEGGVNVGRIHVYKLQLEEEIVKICVAAKSILHNHLIPSSTSAQDAVFYYTLVGDCYRYWAEFKAGEGKSVHASHETSLALYETATKIAEEELHPADYTRLQLALNFSRAMHEGFSGISTLKDESEKTASMEVMELLRENIYLWTRILISGCGRVNSNLSGR
ncbi:hypothetical protein C2S51_033276 [Perilla frutescens var. frutescens]|nr:hypothetical protein C2S51_033276 [Perilla frutescens var. frutescens]